MKFKFHPEAEIEFREAIEFYEQREIGLGQDFSIQVYSAIQNITSYPLAWPRIEDDLRRCIVSRFPYGIIYSIEKDEIMVLAVMHLHRNPNYWKHRQ
jgi:toxin ParE1/3/4